MSRYKLKKLIAYICIYILLGLSNVAIKMIPFKKLVRLISNSGTEYQFALTPKRLTRINSVRQAVLSVSKRTPWRSNCFEQALTANFLLKISGISHAIYFGIKKNDGVILAHAWLKVNDILVTGDNASLDFTAVSVFFYTTQKHIEHHKTKDIV